MIAGFGIAAFACQMAAAQPTDSAGQDPIAQHQNLARRDVAGQGAPMPVVVVPDMESSFEKFRTRTGSPILSKSYDVEQIEWQGGHLTIVAVVLTDLSRGGGVYAATLSSDNTGGAAPRLNVTIDYDELGAVIRTLDYMVSHAPEVGVEISIETRGGVSLSRPASQTRAVLEDLASGARWEIEASSLLALRRMMHDASDKLTALGAH